MDRFVYLDNAATTAVDPAVAEAMAGCLGADGDFANPSSAHAAGAAARRRGARARAQVAALIGAEPDEIVFTSGATESNNLALEGLFRARERGMGRLVTTRIEHKSVLEAAAALARRGVAVGYVDCDGEGRVTPQSLAAGLAQGGALASIMHVNNEIGVVQDIAAIADACRARGVLLHVDAAQSVGKLPIDVKTWGVDLCSLTAHKLHGPKGVGALYVRRGVVLAPLMHGGAQEGGMRPGTLATHQIVGMGKAYELADPEREGPALAALRDQLKEGLLGIDGARLNGSPARSAPHIVNVAFAGVDGESLRFALRDIALSEGSACTSDHPEPSYVLSGLGLSDALAQSALRLSVGRFTRRADIAYTIERVAAAVGRLRELGAAAPAWCSS
jgi:cysteine desulfurase